ncbi:hypothetical protein GGS23DRAFT_476660 [Durotheca rogersii]|uniref:uncharacterized protein n=1 Tax=Durotheca rogersii TaxID=419775 RepID=UPI00221F7525|nr:uncharacterized protein GGS23DRAFT_476660 [Durotheca rogersii]KAI5854100.1 hypothetical protein GGS23DRAFT_476660 [Durotheca rogersii]
MQVPFVQVTDLPTAASFYAAVTQPLGLRYLSAAGSSIVFGDIDSSNPVFEVKKSSGLDLQAPQPCRLVLKAKSSSAVSSFHAAAVRANPDATTNYLHVHDKPGTSGESLARIEDCDGNVMEVVHHGYPDANGSALRRNLPTGQELSRAVDWDVESASSAPSRTVAGSTASSRVVDSDPFSFLRGSAATPSSTESSRGDESKGFSASAVVGTVLGVAVGAAVGGALTYTMMKGDRERVAYQEYETPPAFSRRATFPDPQPDSRPRYVDERASGRPPPYPPSSSGYSQASGRHRTVEELDDRSSRYSSHYTTGSRSRGHSEASSTRRPLMIANAERGSVASSKYSEAPRSLADSEQRSHAGSRHSSRRSPDSEYRSYSSSKKAPSRPREADAETYVSARSEKSTSTIRPGKADAIPRSRAPSKASSQYSSATIKAPTVHRTQSHVSAKNVPQPESTVGSESVWDDDDGSVAPSDSISNVGVRPSKRTNRV